MKSAIDYPLVAVVLATALLAAGDQFTCSVGTGILIAAWSSTGTFVLPMASHPEMTGPTLANNFINFVYSAQWALYKLKH